MTQRPTGIRPVEGDANRRLLLGLVTAVVIMGCFWYFLFRTLRLIGRTSAAGGPLPASGIEFLAVLALCLFLLGVAEVLPTGWMMAMGTLFIAFDIGGHVLLGTASTLLLDRGPVQYVALVLLLATCLQARRLRDAERAAQVHET